MPRSSLRSPAEFQRVFRDGRRARSDGVTAHVVRSMSTAAPSRLGLAVRCRTAVERNRLKRRLRSAWRSFQPAAGYDAALRANEGALVPSYQELETHVHRALKDAGLEGRP